MKVQLRAFSKDSEYLGTLSIAEDLSTEERKDKVIGQFGEFVHYWCLDDKVKEYRDGKIELLSAKEGEEVLLFPAGEKSYIFTKQSIEDKEPIEETIYESELTEFHIDLLVSDLISEYWNPLPVKAHKRFLQIVNSQMAVNKLILNQEDVVHVDYPGKEELPLVIGLTKKEEDWVINGSSFTIEEECFEDLSIKYNNAGSTQRRVLLSYSEFSQLIKKVKEWKSTKKSKQLI
jgi:hypothetical protein